MTGQDGDKTWIGMGALVKRYRQDRRVTQRELAAAAGMSLGALRDLEQGRTRFPRWGAVEDLSAVLHLGQVQRAELARCWRSGATGAPTRRDGAVRRLPGVRISILGPLTVWRGGAQLALGSARQRAVFGLLALHTDSVVHRDTIVDMLWGERPPASAVAKVQAYMSRLRTVLSGGQARAQSADLVTTAGGRCYRLKLGTGRLDLAVFGDLIREARGAVTRREAGCACDRYEQALELWRGDILADVDLLHDHPAAIEATRRLAEAVVAYAKVAADAGTASRVLPHLRDLCAREPLNEQAHALLMTTLATTGQQAAALHLFTELRQRLDTELGISPSPVLTQAHAQVLRQQFGPLG